MRYLIIGNSAAAVGAAEAIREADKTGAITIVSDEPHHTYSRPLISYMLLGKVDRAHMNYRGAEFYEAGGIDFRPGVRIEAIDPKAQTATAVGGETFGYDKLLVAAGSAPFVPPVDGLDTVPRRFAFMTKDDAEALEACLTRESRVLIVGAGLIGLKCAEGIAARVKSVTVVDLADRVLSSVLDADGAEVVRRKLAEHGVAFKPNAGVSRFDVNTAALANGEAIEFDLLVMAVGVRPNVSLIKDAGGGVNRGVVINAKCETSLPNVYAAGDCTESADASDGRTKIMALLPNAYQQGACAGANMAGGEAAFDKAIPMNAVGFFGLHVLTAGNYTGDTYTEADGGENFKRLYYGDNKLNGYILIGDVDKAGVYTALIRERTPLDSIDFELICRKPGLMAFSRDARAQKLGGRL